MVFWEAGFLKVLFFPMGFLVLWFSGVVFLWFSGCFNRLRPESQAFSGAGKRPTSPVSAEDGDFDLPERRTEGGGSGVLCAWEWSLPAFGAGF